MAGRPANLQIRVTSDSRQARQDLSSLEGETSSRLGGLGKKLGPAAAAGGALAAGLFAAALIGGISEALSRGKVTGKLGAQLGIPPDEAKRLGKIAGKLYTDGVTESFEAGASAIRAVIGGKLVDAGAPTAEIEKIARKVSDLTTTFEDMGADVNSVTNAAAQMFRTKLAPSADYALDLITRGFQQFGPQADDLLDTVTEYSVQFAALGLSGQDAFELMGQALDSGARNLDLVADTLKEFNIEAVQGGTKVREGWKKLGLDADKMAESFAKGGPAARDAFDLMMDKLREVSDPLKQNTIAIELFGTKSEDVQKALLALDVTPGVTKFGEVAGAADKMGESLRDNAGTTMDSLIRKIKEEFVQAGDAFISKSAEISGVLKDNLMPSTEGVNNLLGPFKSGWEDARTIFSDLEGPLSMLWDGLKDLFGALGDLNEETHATDVIFYTLGATFGGIISVIGLVAAAFGLLFSAIGWVVDKTSDLVGWIKKIDWPDLPSGWGPFGDTVKWLADQVARLVDWIGRIDWPSPPGWLSDLGGALNPFSAFSAAPAGLTARSMAADEPAQRAYARPLNVQPVTHVTVILDGQPVRGIVQRVVGSAMSADGARLMAGGWA